MALSLAYLVGSAGPGQAKEYEVDGIIDRGRRSGQRCDFDGVLYLRTEHVTGWTERIKIDVKWMQDTLPKLDQDDRIILLIEDVPGGGIRALSVSKVHKLDGTSTKTSSAAPAVDEFRSCSPITSSLTTTCTFTTSGLVYEGGPAQITYLLAGGGTASTPEVFGSCVASRAPGEVC